jgi:hypothetical protein
MMVIRPLREIGKYGGIWRRGLSGRRAGLERPQNSRWNFGRWRRLSRKDLGGRATGWQLLEHFQALRLRKATRKMRKNKS